jgi:hypothetical protein
VQSRHRPMRIPPLAGQPRKSRYLILIDSVRAPLPPVHALAPTYMGLRPTPPPIGSSEE